jgi:putative peptidoglycan lipid II flippase
MPYFLVDGIITRGETDSQAAGRIAEVLRHFAWGVPAFVLAKVFTPPFFARQRTKQPAQFALVSVAVNTALGAALWFGLPMIDPDLDGAVGLAIATSTAGWLNVFLLAGTLAREKVYVVSGRAWSRLFRLGLACAAMAAFITPCALEYQLLARVLISKEIAVVLVSGVGFAIFIACALLFRAVTLAEIKSSLRREKGTPGAHGGLPGGMEG